MPNMLKKISVHSSKATAGAIAESADVTLVSDDNSAVSANNEEMQHLEAHPCADCEDNCEGFILETVDNGVTPASDDHSQLMTQAATALVVWDPALWMEREKCYSLLQGHKTRHHGDCDLHCTGLTAKTFKARFNGHNTTFNNREAKQTTLSRHCWSLKDNDIPFTRNLSILAHARP